MEQFSLFAQEVPQPLAARLRPQTLDEFVGQTHYGEELPLFLRERIDHGCYEHGIDIGITVGKRACPGQCAQIQIYRGKPSLAGV